MLRSRQDKDVEKLYRYFQTKKLIEKRIDDLKEYFKSSSIDHKEYENNSTEFDSLEELDTFYIEKSADVERKSNLVAYDTKSRFLPSSTMLEFLYDKNYDTELGEDGIVLDLFYSSRIYFRSLEVYDLTHFKELLDQYLNENRLIDSSEFKYKYEIIEKNEDNEFNHKYKISIFTDNDIKIDLLMFPFINEFKSVEIYSHDFTYSFQMASNNLDYLDQHFSLKKMMKAIVSSAKENKLYKLPRK